MKMKLQNHKRFARELKKKIPLKAGLKKEILLIAEESNCTNKRELIKQFDKELKAQTKRLNRIAGTGLKAGPFSMLTDPVTNITLTFNEQRLMGGRMDVLMKGKAIIEQRL